MRVLLVEDDYMIGQVVQQGLRDASYGVDWVVDGEAALHSLACLPYEMVLLDLGLPKKDGMSVLRAIRANGQRIPVLLLSARDATEDRVAGLDGGADDYLVKPFQLSELLARMRAAVRHQLQVHGERPVFRVGDLSVDLVRRIVKVGDSEVKLSPKEYDLLRVLVQHAGKVPTHQFLIRQVWGGSVDVQNLRILVRQVRQKIDPDPERPQHILTETGVGYRLRVPD